MKRTACWLALAAILCLAPAMRLHAQGGEAKGEAAEATQVREEKEPAEIWKWANFLLLAGGLGWLINKHAPPFFKARSEKITLDMVEAQKLRAAAEAKVADVERRLSNLEGELRALRGESEKEIAAEAERLKQRAADEIAKIQHNSLQEIEAAGKAARQELKRYTADLAVALAERKMRDQMTPATQDSLVSGFVRDLDKPSASRN